VSAATHLWARPLIAGRRTFSADHADRDRRWRLLRWQLLGGARAPSGRTRRRRGLLTRPGRPIRHGSLIRAWPSSAAGG